MKRSDFHIHTNYSDGVFELESGELIKPRKKGNKTIYHLERADIITVNLA